jgi:predicted ATP-grasp superfamily ATP-dependent carboligase
LAAQLRENLRSNAGEFGLPNSQLPPRSYNPIVPLFYVANPALSTTSRNQIILEIEFVLLTYTITLNAAHREKTCSMSVLVTHAHNRLAYYTTRILGKHDIKVVCASEFPLATCFFSRYCTHHFTYPSPWEQPKQFIDKVIEEIEKQEIDVLMPVHREGYILSKYKDILDQHVKFPYSPYAKIVSVNDKKMLTEIAKKASVRTPKTATPSNLDQIKETTHNLRFPTVIKLRRGHGGRGMSIVKDPTQLTDKYLRTLKRFKISSPEDYPIIQEYIQGEYESLGMLFNHGKLRAKFSTKGHPTRVQDYRYLYEADGDPGPTEALTKLGDHLKWHGIIHGGFITEKDTDLTYLLDINPRFWGGTSFAALCGIEFPYLLYQIAMEGDVEPELDYQEGLKGRWFWGDLSNIPKYTQTREWKKIYAILTCREPLDFWDQTDPLPFFILPIYYLTQALNTGTMLPLIEKY